MALKIGSLFVSLDANASGLFRTLSRAMDDVEKFAKHVKRAAKDVAEVSTAMTAMGASALHLASQIDGPTARAMADLEVAAQQLSVPIAKMLLPAVAQLAAGMRDMSRWVDGLNPGLKRTAVTIAEWVVGIGGAAFVVGKFSGILSGVAGALSSVFGAIASIGLGPILAMVAGVGALIVMVVALHRAWRTNWLGIKDITATVVESLAEFFGEGTKWISDAWASLFKSLHQQMFDFIKNVALLQKLSGVKWIDTDMMQGALAAAFTAPGKILADALKLGKSTATEFAAGFKEELGIISKELGIDKLMKGLSSGGHLASSGLPTVSQTKPVDFLPTAYSFANDGKALAKIDAKMMAISITRLKEEGDLLLKRVAFDRKAAEAAQRNAERLAAIGNGLKIAGNILLSKLGDAGQIIGSAVQGFEAGGPIGAALAVIAEFITRTESFGQMVEFANAAIAKTAATLSPLISAVFDSLRPVVEGSMSITRTLLRSLSPAFQVLATALLGVGPIFSTLASMLVVVGPIIALAMGPLQAAATALEGAMFIVYKVLSGVSIVLLAVAGGMVKVWNTMVISLGKIVDDVVSYITAGQVKDAGSFIKNMAFDPSQIDAAYTRLTSTIFDLSFATETNTVAQLDAAASVSKFSESLTNVPSGFKVAAAQFNAQDGIGGFSLAGAGAGGGDTFIEISDVQIVTDDPVEMLRGIKAQAQKGRFRKKGNRHGGDT